MEKFTSTTSTVVPLPRQDVDTDMIVPAQFLTTISNNGFADALFRRLRDQDTDFPLNKPRYKNSSILVAKSNFGCGSSREHAVWALRDWGFKVLIAESFADIFHGNAAKNGLLLVTLAAPIIDSLLLSSADQDITVTVDLEKLLVTLPGGEGVNFEYDPFRRHCLLNGLDDLDYILSHQKELATFHGQDDQRLFFSSHK